MIDIAAVRARFVSPPGPCPVCGAERIREFEPEDSVERWVCPNGDILRGGPQMPSAFQLTPDEYEAALARYQEAMLAWCGSPEYDELLRHERASEITIWPNAEVAAILDAILADPRVLEALRYLADA